MDILKFLRCATGSVLMPFVAVWAAVCATWNGFVAWIREFNRSCRDSTSRYHTRNHRILFLGAATVAGVFLVSMFAIPVRSNGMSLLGGIKVRSKINKREYKTPIENDLMWNTVAFGIPVFLSFIARMVTRGWVLKRMHIDDSLMLLYFCLVILVNFAGQFETNLYPKAFEARILANPANAYYRIFGSQLGAGVEQAMLIVNWGSKLCIWFFLQRLHRELPRFEAGVWLLFCWIWVGLFIIEILFFFGLCMPFPQYWAMPVTNPECANHHTYAIVQVIFNVSSDIGLILAPLPMIWVAQLPWKRLLILIAIIGLGCFKIVAALMNQKYLDIDHHTNKHYLAWNVREVSTSIFIANTMCNWQLLQYMFQFTSFTNTSFSIDDDGALTDNHGFRHRVLRMVNRCRNSVSGIPGFGIGHNIVSARNAEATFSTTDTELEDRKRWEDRRRESHFSLERDGDDGRPAILYRSMHNIA